MWVRSQDKFDLVDVKECYIINACIPFKDNQNIHEYRIVKLMHEPSIKGSMLVLGIYKTGRKAMSVLDELQCRIARSESGVFQMPEDEE